MARVLSSARATISNGTLCELKYIILNIFFQTDDNMCRIAKHSSRTLTRISQLLSSNAGYACLKCSQFAERLFDMLSALVSKQMITYSRTELLHSTENWSCICTPRILLKAADNKIQMKLKNLRRIGKDKDSIN